MNDLLRRTSSTPSTTSTSRIFRFSRLIASRDDTISEYSTLSSSPRMAGRACYPVRDADASHQPSARVDALLAREREIGFEDIETYARFAEKVHRTKRQLLSFLIECKEKGAKLCGYGAPGKGNTLLNYCAIGTDFLEFTR